MTLKEWVNTLGMSQVSVAKMFNISKFYMNHLIQGRYEPSYRLAFKIEKMSDGKVTIDELINLNKTQGV